MVYHSILLHDVDPQKLICRANEILVLLDKFFNPDDNPDCGYSKTAVEQHRCEAITSSYEA